MASSATASDSETSGKHPSILKELFRAYQLSSQESITDRTIITSDFFQIILAKCPATNMLANSLMQRIECPIKSRTIWLLMVIG